MKIVRKNRRKQLLDEVYIIGLKEKQVEKLGNARYMLKRDNPEMFKEGRGKLKKLLFFHAPWCPLCRFYDRQFIEPLEKLIGYEKICSVKVQDKPFMAEKYSVDKFAYSNYSRR